MVLLSFILLCVCDLVRSVVVWTNNGGLNGTVYTTYQGKQIYGFFGVPYAEPPIGRHRFKEPQPIKSWKGIRTAQEYGASCIQYNMFYLEDPDIVGDEDCLSVNIYTPSLSRRAKLDVIFYIHGGGFMFGSGKGFTPYYLLDYFDGIYVSVNYRVGVFGFIATEDGVIPGNNGMKDQVMALRWLKQNIERFGGNKHSITLAGLSAGGASVHLHYMSPLSRHLFARGISVSGTALCPWVLAEETHAKTKTLASSLGCPTNNSKDMLKCLQLVPAKRIILQQLQFFTWNFNPFSPFGVVVENSSTAFLHKHPYKLLKEGDIKDVPWLTSMTLDEGLYPVAYFKIHEEMLKDLDEHWYTLAPQLLDFNYTVKEELRNGVSFSVRKHYFGDQAINKDTRQRLTDMVSDRMFNADIDRATRMHASATKSPVYFYKFGYRGTSSISDIFCKCHESLGISHGDDLIYLLQIHGVSPVQTERDQNMVKTMTGIWNTFVHSGVPSIGCNTKWHPVANNVSNGGNLTYILIRSSKDFQQMSSADLGNRAFWDHLPFQEQSNAVKIG